MGNLLGSPITTKDTHVGRTHVVLANDNDDCNNNEQQLQYGISSMQGWRIHMEDAHIAQPFLFAEYCVDDAEDVPSPTETTKRNYIKIPLPNHSLFAVFDGHGGTFAAEYASRNLLRVLSRQKSFVAYAQRWKERESYFASLQNDLLDGGDITTTSAEEGQEEAAASASAAVEEKELDDKERLQRFKERGRQSDEKVKQIKERVQRHLDGEDVSSYDDNVTSEATTTTANKASNSLEMAKAAYDQELMTLLEHALCDAFCDVDAEILREVRGMENDVDANTIYGEGYCPHDDVGEDVGVGHLPKESTSGKVFDNDDGVHDADYHQETADAVKEALSPPSLDVEDSGTTAIVVVLTPKWIVCANSGDSRAVYSKSNHRAVPLSYDHKPEDEDEERRIREAGGYVSGGRVEGDLAVSRGLGDFRFKDMEIVLSGSSGENRDRRNPMDKNDEEEDADAPSLPAGKPSEQKVSPVPDIIVQNRDATEDEFIVIACDGIWDVQTNQECVQMVADIFSEGESDIGLVCEEILDLCLIKGSKDNMTASVIKFPKQVIGTGGGVRARRERRGANSTEENGQQFSSGLRRSPTPNPYVPRQPSEEDDEGKLL